MNIYRSKPMHKNVIQWNGENSETIEKIIGDSNVQGTYFPENKLLIKQGTGNLTLKLSDWLIVEADGYYQMSNETFLQNHTKENLN